MVDAATAQVHLAFGVLMVIGLALHLFFVPAL